jgi:hypothetical protein
VVTALPCIAGLALRALAALHPMHTSVAELVSQPSTGSVIVTLRIFADDFRTAVPGGPVRQAEPYVRSQFELRDSENRLVNLQWEDIAQAGDVIQIRLRADLAHGLGGVRVHDQLLCDRFADQVNIVRATYGGRTTSLLFTPGDQAKALP